MAAARLPGRAAARRSMISTDVTSCNVVTSRAVTVQRIECMKHRNSNVRQRMWRRAMQRLVPRILRLTASPVAPMHHDAA